MNYLFVELISAAEHCAYSKQQEKPLSTHGQDRYYTILQVMNTGCLGITLLLFLGVVNAIIKVRNGRLVDAQGGELLFHGLNLVSKVPPYHTHFNEKDMQMFEQIGINGIRLGVMWPGVEPKDGQFNETYLQLMKNTTQTAYNYGIHTLVEFHQDLFSQKFCADGVPIWAISEHLSRGFPRPLNLQPYSYDERGYPKGCGNHPWAEYYFSKAVGRSFEALWTNKHGMRDRFIRYWKKVAQTFRNNPQVIAYEISNQPWPGDQFANPLVMIPGLSEKLRLQKAYDIIAEEIRTVDPEHSICYEPVTWLNNFKAGFTHPPGGVKRANQSIFCYHYYNPPTLNLPKFMQARMKDVKRLRGGGLLSEFYVIDNEGDKNVAMMDECDKHHQSWFGWLYDIQSNDEDVPKHLQSQDNFHSIFYDQNGEVHSTVVKAVTRTFAQRVAGHTMRHYFNPSTKQFSLSYQICVQCGETVVFVSRKHIYTSGYSLECLPKGGVQCREKGQHRIKVTPIDIENGQTVLVMIRPT